MRRPAGVGGLGSLRRRIHLGADPDVVLAGIGVDAFHQLARLVRDARADFRFLYRHDFVLLAGWREAAGIRANFAPIRAGPLPYSRITPPVSLQRREPPRLQRRTAVFAGCVT